MANSPFRLTFMSLPKEIRDMIYILALCSSSPIIVWNGKCAYESISLAANATGYYGHSKRTYIWRRVPKRFGSTPTCLSRLSRNLLFCTSIISQEAAEIFYKTNTFSFLGEHNWDLVLSWLQSIGAENRNYLSSLRIDAKKPRQVWQRFNGERVQRPNDSIKETIYPRSPHLGVRMRPFKYGLVDNINPAVETIFQLLGQRTSIQKLKVIFKTCYDYPGQGSIIENGVKDPENGWHSMDFPNLVEKLRMIYACKPGLSDTESSIDVLWEGDCRPWIRTRSWEDTISRAEILDHIQNIENHGWEIDIPLFRNDFSDSIPHDWTAEIPTYTLRRKLEGPLMGEDPNPYSGIFIRPGSEEADMEKVTGWYS